MVFGSSHRVHKCIFRVVSRPNLPVLVLTLTVLVLLLNKTKTLLISTVRSQPQSCDYYRSLRPTVPVSTWCTLLSTSCSHGTIFVYTSDICASWKGVPAIQPPWPMRPHCAILGESVLSHLNCVLEVQQAPTTRMWLHGHWALYQLRCRCSEWFDFIDSVLVLH